MLEKFRTLEEKLGTKATSDRFECSFYSRDLASVPDVMTKIMFNTMPDLVVRPASVEDIVEVIRFAAAQHCPVTSRAGATTAYMNTVPTNGGIVLDLNGLRGVLSVDKEALQVEVWCGTPWLEVEDVLNNNGLALCSYPSSGVAATVGGWFNTEGFGIGSIHYGGFHDLVEWAEVVLPSGEIIESERTGPYPLHWFLGKEGTLGVVTRIRFKVREQPEQILNMALGYQSMQNLQKGIQLLSNESVLPFNLHFSDNDCLAMQQTAGFEVPFTNRHILAVSYQGHQAEVAGGKEAVLKIAKLTEAEILAPSIAEEEWEERLYALKMKRGGPTMLAGESVLAVEKIADFHAAVKKINQRVAVYGHMMGRDKVNILAQYYADDSKQMQYLFLLPRTKRIYDAAISRGGRPYGVGVWNSPYLQRAYPAQLLQERIRIKEQLDPANIMNPGKFYAPPRLLNPALFGLGSGVANGLSTLLGIGKGR